MFTSIHRALGAAPGPLTWQMIEQLVEQHVEEAADLDFKQILPIGKGEWRDEAAKDFAAMANSGGGVVLYGIAEERGRGTAKKIEPITVDEVHIRSLTQIAYALVHPPLMDIQPVKIAHPQQPDRSVLAMVVPPSVELPHMYWKKEAFLAPVRHGSDTRWMDERQIEQAFSERFEGRRRRQADLAEFYDETLACISPHTKVCLVAVASPASVKGMIGYPSEVGSARDFFDSALPSVKDFIRSESSVMDNFSASPAIGLRRWRWLAKDQSGQTNHLLELHRDGSVALVADIGGELISDRGNAGHAATSAWKPETKSLAVEFAMAGLGMFLSAVAQQTRNDGGYEVRAGLTWDAGSDGSLPLKMYLSHGRLSHASRPEILRRFAPVQGLLRARRSSELRADLHLFCRDMLNQAGLDEINYLRDN